MCVGAFDSATWTMLMKSSAMPPLLRFIIAILIGAAAAAVFGFLIGIPVLRLKGDYLAIVNLGNNDFVVTVATLYFARSSPSRSVRSSRTSSTHCTSVSTITARTSR